MIDEMRFHNMSYAEIGMEFQKLLDEINELRVLLIEAQAEISRMQSGGAW